MTPNLGASLDLLADYILHPKFDPGELERVRTQQLTAIRNELNNPIAIGQRAMAATLFGDQHPYGLPPSGTGDPAVVATLSRDEIADFHRVWLRPEKARIIVVGDTTLADVTRMLEKSFGGWQAPPVPAPDKSYDAPIPAPQPRIVLIDRPASPQSVIIAGRVLDHKGTDDLTVLRAANEVFGGSFLSRINMDLRETKGWSYGVQSVIRSPLDRTSFLIFAPVQADKTGDSIAALRSDLAAYTSTEGVTKEELERLINGNVRELPGSFETGSDVLGGIGNIVTYGRPDNYYEALAGKYEALTAAELDTAARADFKGDQLVYVVVGDAKTVRPQLDALGLSVEERSADANAAPAADASGEEQ